MIHIEPKFRDLIPPLGAEERAQLEANILRDGCLDPLVLWDDVLIDGHNRYEICTRNDIPFQTVQINGLVTVEDAVLWILHKQLGRRNLTDFMRAEMALKAKPAIAAKARASQSTSSGGTDPQLRQNSDEAAPMRTDDEVGKLAGVSRDTLRKVEKIQKTAVPEIVEAVRKGDVSINAAAKMAALPADEQHAIAAEPGLKKIASSPKKVAQPASDSDLLAENEALRAENADLREQLSEMASNLKDATEDNESMSRVFESDDKVTAAMAEAKRYRDMAGGFKSRIDGLMNEKNAAVSKVKALQRQLDKVAA